MKIHKVDPVYKSTYNVLNHELYMKGYEHGLKSNELTDFRKSFRLGFRDAKLYLRNLNKV